MSAWSTAVSVLTPFAWWTFNNGNFVDSVSGQTNGSTPNSYLWANPGQPPTPGAYSFDTSLLPGDAGGQSLRINFGRFQGGSNDYAFAPNLIQSSRLPNVYSYTFFWKWDGLFGPDGATGSTSNQAPCLAMGGQFTGGGFPVAVYTSPDLVGIAQGPTNGLHGTIAYSIADANSWYQTTTPIDKILDGAVHMFTVVAGANSQFLYLDGVQIHSAPRGTKAQPSNYFTLSSAGYYATHNATGWWDEIVFFNYELTQAQVTSLWNASGVVPLTYVIPPGQRFAYDVDGTLVTIRTQSGVPRQLTQSELRTMIADNNDVVVLPPLYAPGFAATNPPPNNIGTGEQVITMVFPEVRALYAVQLLGGYTPQSFPLNTPVAYPNGAIEAAVLIIETSIDTTNGVDGTWTAATVTTLAPPAANYPYVQGSPAVAFGTSHSYEFVGWGNDGVQGQVVSRTVNGITFNVDATEWWSTDWDNSGVNVSYVTFRLSREILRKRMGIPATPIPAIRGLRIRVFSHSAQRGLLYGGCLSLQMLHIYGEPVGTIFPNAPTDIVNYTGTQVSQPGTLTDPRFELTVGVWEATQDAPTALAKSDGTSDSDQGTVAVEESRDWMFRVKNRSSFGTAHNITVTADAPHDNPSVAFTDMLFFATTLDYHGQSGTDAGGEKSVSNEVGLPNIFVKSLNIGSLAPGESSAILICRRVTPQAAGSGFFMPRILAQVGSWTQ